MHESNYSNCAMGQGSWSSGRGGSIPQPGGNRQLARVAAKPRGQIRFLPALARQLVVQNMSRSGQRVILPTICHISTNRNRRRLTVAGEGYLAAFINQIEP
jgi:hypothetical protein